MSAWPAWCYNPENGYEAVFQSPADPPRGWRSRHAPADDALLLRDAVPYQPLEDAEPAPIDIALGMSDDELRLLLREAGLKVPSKATRADMSALLEKHADLFEATE